MNILDPQNFRLSVIVGFILFVAIVWGIIKIRKHLTKQEFRKCTDVFLEERYLKGELIKKNMPKRV